MKIIFVRHGHPNYKDDCLTELGHLHAKAAANRLSVEKIDKIFSSTCGRAYQTACHISEYHNLDVAQLDFMREINWGAPGTDDFVDPWGMVNNWVKNDKEIMLLDWQNDIDYKNRTVTKSYNMVSQKFDEWLSSFGLKREGKYYRILKENEDTIMLVSHAGASSVVLSHIFNLPFSFVCRAISPDFTAVTQVSFKGKKGDLTSPVFDIVNDARHIKNISLENT